jgi:hypothetical protein
MIAVPSAVGVVGPERPCMQAGVSESSANKNVFAVTAKD